MFKHKSGILFLVLLIFSVPLIIFLSERNIDRDWNHESEIKEIDLEEEIELKEQIGQMLMFGFRGTEIEPDSHIIKVIKEAKIGGVVLFDYDIPSRSYPRNIIDPNQTRKLISNLQEHSSTPLFVSVDVEGGKINRLKSEYGFSDFLSAKELGKIGEYEITKEEALKISKELKELGFNMNFAPVIDVDINSNNPVIGALDRSFSSDYREVVLHAKKFIEAHNENNTIPVVKHFPGHGSSFNDSHLGIVDVTETYKEEELFPYKELQNSGLLDVVMTAHIFNRNIDENYPVTLSHTFLSDMLRDEIKFKGVIISDDMQMKAISDNYGIEEAVIKAINSGCDILLFSNNSNLKYDENLAQEIQQIIYKAVQDGEISEQRITESYNRIINLKKDFNIIQ